MHELPIDRRNGSNGSLAETSGRIVQHVEKLVIQEFHLVRAEVRAFLQQGLRKTAFGLAAGVQAVVGVIFVAWGLAHALLALGCAPWFAYLAVGVLYLGIAAGLVQATSGKQEMEGAKETP